MKCNCLNRLGEWLESLSSNWRLKVTLSRKIPVALPSRSKRTTPFVKQCNFIVDVGFGELEQCDSDADFGIYYGDDVRVKMTSLCHFHTIYQESLWIGEQG
jgi:hypothetical protein